MKAKHFRFGRLSTAQVGIRVDELNEFLETVDVVGVPQLTGNDEEGTVLFVFYTDKKEEEQQPKNNRKEKWAEKLEFLNLSSKLK